MAGEYRWHLMSDILRNKKLELIALLGGKCKSCEETDPDLLEFHHPFGKNWRSRDLSRFQRLAKYEEEIKLNLVELLCDDCHNDPREHPADCFCPKCRGEENF